MRKRVGKGREGHSERRETIHAWSTLRWRLIGFVFLIMLSSGILALGVYLLLGALFARFPFFEQLMFNPYSLLIVILLICSVIGTVLAAIFGFYYLRPMKRLIHAVGEVKKGNFKVQVEEMNPESEMGKLVSDFNGMVRELDGIELFRNDFINNFSHEFKTPIVSVRGFARELLHGDLTDAEREEYLRIIVEESDRLARLSTSVLELSKLENREIVTGKSDFYLDEQLRQCILLLESSWTEKELEMIPELEEVRVWANEEIFAHIWNNLLSNAIKFTPNGGTVRVTLKADAEEVCVTVEDTGIGMTDEVREHIFEKFYQGDSSHSKGGYGIGLAMAESAVRLSGGRITVESELGQGSRFTVTLPRKTVVEAEIVE